MERAKAKTFEDLVVWRKAPAMVMGIYKMSGDFPRNEIYGLDVPDAPVRRVHTGQHRRRL